MVSPAWLLLIALAGLILVFHARRRRRVPVASVRIWQLLEQSSARRAVRWPPPSLLLLLQLLLVVLIALALAQPQFGAGAGEPDHVVYVLDTSGSMRTLDGRSDRQTAALDHLAGRIRTLADAGRVSVVTAGAIAELWVARQTDPSGILPIVREVRATDGEADWPAAARWVATTLRPGERTRIVVLTDGADAGGLDLAVPDVEIERVLFGAPAANAGLEVAVEPVRDAADAWKVSATVRAPSGGDVPAPSALFAPAGSADFLDWGAIPEREPVAPPAADGTARAFEAKLVFPGPGTLLVTLPEDAGPQDNSAWFVLRSEPRQVRVLFLGVASPELAHALQAIPDVSLLTADALPADSAAFDLVIANDVALDRHPGTNVLWLARAGLRGETEPRLVPDPGVTGWDSEHPLSRNVDWSRLAVGRAYRVARLPGAAVLAEASAAPLIQARTTALGREVRIGADLSAAAWTSDPGFPVFVTNLVDWLGVARGSAVAPCVVGSPCPIEARLAAHPVLAPDGVAANAPAPASGWLLPGAANFVPLRAGLYRIEGDRGAPIAVNPPGTVETTVNRTGAAAGRGPVEPGRRWPQPWWWLVLAGLAVVLAEGWIAGRGSERFLHRGALARGMPHSERRRAILVVRGLAILFLAAALLQVPRPRLAPAENRVVIAGTDLQSAPPEPVRATLLAGIGSGFGRGESARLGWVTPGPVARVMTDLDRPVGDAAAEPAPAAPAADLQQAVLLAAAMLPGDRPGSILLAADGNETAGRLAEATGRLAARAIPVDVLPLVDLPPGEVMVEALTVPGQVRAGDTLPLAAVLLSERETAASVVVSRGDSAVVEREVTLQPGRNRVDTTVAAGEAGEAVFAVAVTAAGDTFAANNRKGVAVTVGPPPSVLVLATDVAWGEYFAGALAAQNLSATVVASSRAPQYLDDWLAYDVVVLMDVPAIDLDTRQQQMLEQIVEVHGRGLLILGGEHAFGPGGYFQTALERLSPLSSRIPHEAPRAAMAFVLDRSGSMQATVEDLNRLEIAKAATVSAVGLLHEESQVAVVVFDSEARVIVPLQDRVDEAAIREQLAPLQPGGGTALLPALTAALEELRRADADARHIVVMTDGLLEAADFTPLMSEIRAAGITVSVVAIGEAADVPRLGPLARLGGGAFHATRDFKALPSILSQEALLMSGKPVRETTAEVFWEDRSAAFLAGLPDRLPPLESYVATSAQPGAAVHLALHEEAEEVPVLASWRYGTGRVLAFASHGAGSGTQNWLRMPEYPLLWAQVIRHFLPITAGPGLHVALRRHGDEVLVTADLLDGEGAPVSGESVSIAPVGLPGEPVRLHESGAGRYSAELGVVPPGTERFAVTAGATRTEAALDPTYPSRLDFGRADPDRLTALAAATGGTVLTGESAAAPAPLGWTARPDWRLWTLIGLALFLLDLAIRYLPHLLRTRARAPAAVATARQASRSL